MLSLNFYPAFDVKILHTFFYVVVINGLSHPIITHFFGKYCFRWEKNKNKLSTKLKFLKKNLLQIIVGILLIFSSYIQSKLINPTNNEGGDQKPKFKTKLFRINLINLATIGFVFLVAVMKIFITSWSLSESTTPTTPTTSISTAAQRLVKRSFSKN